MIPDLKDYEDDHVWVHDNWTDLLRKYSDQWIGVRNKKVIASDSDLDDLLSKLPDPAHTAVEYITPKQMEIILCSLMGDL